MNEISNPELDKIRICEFINNSESESGYDVQSSIHENIFWINSIWMLFHFFPLIIVLLIVTHNNDFLPDDVTDHVRIDVDNFVDFIFPEESGSSLMPFSSKYSMSFVIISGSESVVDSFQS